MVEKSCYLYDDRESLLLVLDMLFGGRLDLSKAGFHHDNIKEDVERLQWENVLQGWDIPWLV
jgi:hypothetical protein